MLKLFSPGPVPIPDFVQKALTKAVIHHRSLEFELFYADFLSKLKYIFQTEKGVCSCMGSGTYGVEMAIYSLFSAEDELLIPSQGKFSHRWANYARMKKMKVHDLLLAWGKAPRTDEILDLLAEHPHTKGLILTHSETSTGALLDLEEIAFAVKKEYPEILILVDGITSIGSLPYYHDAWGIDCSVIASQKSLMSPAGLVAFAFSDLAEKALKPTDLSDFQNLFNHLKSAEKNSSAFTPPVQLLFGVGAAMKHIQAESLPAIWNRVHKTASYFRSEIEALGAEIFPDFPSDSLSSFSFSENDCSELKEKLEKEYNMIVSGGQGKLKGEILRVSHMGFFDTKDMKELLEAIKNLL